MNIIERLRTVWPAEFELQPETAAQRHNVIEIQRLKADAADEIERLRSYAECDADCPCCGEIEKCHVECTFAEDNRSDVWRMIVAREALFGK